jgi:hypothetical protein
MKIKSLKISALLALAGISLFATSAKATNTYTDGDLLLGFFASGGTGATSTYVVDLGSATNFTSAGSDLSLSIGNIGADLAAVYGSSWNTRSDLYWGVYGSADLGSVGSFPTNTVWGTKAEATIGTKVSAPASGSSSTLSQPAGKIFSVGNAYDSVNGNGYTNTANSSVAVIEATGDTNSFSSFQTTTTAFGYFNNPWGNFGSGTTGTALDLFTLKPGTVATRSSTYNGTFHIDNSGGVSFTLQPTAVPEPSTVYAALALVGLIAFRARRRIVSLFAHQS